MIKIQENNIEWLSGQQKFSACITQEKFKNRIRMLASERPDLCTIIKTNDDGSIFCHIDASCIKIFAPKKLTEEERKEMEEKLKVLK